MTISPLRGKRLIEVQLVGEAYANEGLQRGVSIFPTIDDEVYVVTGEDLKIIYGSTTNTSYIQVGWHSASEGLPALVNIENMVLRHCAIVGSKDRNGNGSRW